MTSLTRTALAATGTLALSAVLVLGGAGAANAYPVSVGEVDAVVFSNSNVVDGNAEGELEHIVEDIDTFGLASVVQFDGGDGSAAAWTAALADKELLVMPEQEVGNFYNTGGTPWASDAALAVIKAWVEAGNYFILAGSQSYTADAEDGGSYYGSAPLMSALTCLAIANEELYTFDDEDVDYVPAVELVGAPDPLPYRDGTYALVSDVFSAPLAGIATEIYTADVTLGGGQVLNTLGAVTFGVGNGAVIYLSYDWFWNDEDSGSAEWYNVLQLAVSGEFPYTPQPVCGQLAATGAETPVLPIAAGAGFLLLAGAVALIMVRRRTA
jgi:hypothetical protein